MTSKLYVTMGRAFKVLAEFPDTEEGERLANAYMIDNPGAALLAIDNGVAILADENDKGKRLDSLECSCCGGGAGRFVQWHNRDTGYGVCPKCATWMLVDRGQDPEEFKRCYGVAGINYADPWTES